MEVYVSDNDQQIQTRLTIKLEKIQVHGKTLAIVHLEYRPANFADAENRDICRMKKFPVVLFQCEM